jgi:hypothetical protein
MDYIVTVNQHINSSNLVDSTEDIVFFIKKVKQPVEKSNAKF